MQERETTSKAGCESPSPIASELILCSLVFVALCARSLFLQYRVNQQLAFADDAYYYIVLAQNLVHHGKSTFDGVSLTNGYHPLWMLLLAMQYKVFGASLLLTRLIEFGLGLGSLLFTLLVVRLPNQVLNLIFTLGLFLLLSRFAFNGMETTLFAFCFALFIWHSQRRSTSTRAPGILDGFLAALAIGARIDSAVFLLPQLFLNCTSRTRKAVAFATLSLCGLAYIAINRHLFGVNLPVSGGIKSLGGFQLNHKLLQQLTSSKALHDPLQSLTTYFYLAFAFWLLSGWLLRRTLSPALRSIMKAYLIGFPVFLVRVLFFSSWRLWIWYDYPVLVGYIGCAPVLLLLLQKRAERIFSHTQLVTASAMIAILAAWICARGLLKTPVPGPLGYFYINHLALDRYASTLQGQTIAMGDRAGNFAYQYAGGVDQIEGLMNDAAYFQTIRSQGDVKTLLCQRNVHFIAAYEDDLGDYTTHRIDTIRPQLSQFPAPQIQVARTDQIGRVFDLSQFNARSTGDTNFYLYLWKLPCPSPELQAEAKR